MERWKYYLKVIFVPDIYQPKSRQLFGIRISNDLHTAYLYIICAKMLHDRGHCRTLQYAFLSLINYDNNYIMGKSLLGDTYKLEKSKKSRDFFSCILLIGINVTHIKLLGFHLLIKLVSTVINIQVIRT